MRYWPILVTCLLVGGCLARHPVGYPDWRKAADRFPAPQPLPERVILLQDEALPAAVIDRMVSIERLLVVIPGVSSGVLADSLRWSEGLRRRSGHDLVVFYDWRPGDSGRGVLSAGSSSAAGTHLADVLSIVALGPGRPTIDVFAHSGGSVVLRKAARTLDDLDSPVRFRHVVFTGTPVQSDARLAPTIERCDALCNVVSHTDKVIRRLSDHERGLDMLGAEPPYWNQRMDESLTGQMVRHMTYLQDGPDMIGTWAILLETGRWPRARHLPDERMVTLDQLHEHTLWLHRNNLGDRADDADFARDLIEDGDHVEATYGVMMAAILRDPAAWRFIDERLRDPKTPAWMRLQIYRYLANRRDPEHLPVLEYCEEHDPANEEELEFILRELQRHKVERPFFESDG